MTLLRLNPIGIGYTGDENTQKNKNMQKIRRSAELFARCASFCMHSLENGSHFLTKRTSPSKYKAQSVCNRNNNGMC